MNDPISHARRVKRAHVCSSEQGHCKRAFLRPRAAFVWVFSAIVLISVFGYADVAFTADSSAQNSATKNGWQSGVHFTTLDPPQFAEDVSGVVEVVEVFSYACPHCASFEPHLAVWEKAQGRDVRLVRVPLNFGKPLRAYAHLYYTLRALDRIDLHQSVYDAIHRDKRSLVSPSNEEAETLTLLLQFAKNHGVDESEFKRAYSSKAVAENIEKAERLSLSYKTESVPAIIVNGRYKTDAQRVGSEARLIAIMQDLVTEQLISRPENASAGTPP